MDAPMYSEETVLRAMEAMRESAKVVTQAGRETASRNGHAAAVAAKDAAAVSIGGLDTRTILATIANLPSHNPTEIAAFEKEAERLGFAVSRRDNGNLFYPMTQRVWEVWQAAVRWKAGEPS